MSDTEKAWATNASDGSLVPGHPEELNTGAKMAKVQFSCSDDRIKGVAACMSDVGQHRERQEDSVLCQPPLFVVADGMGGLVGGDLASQTAVNTLLSYASEIKDEVTLTDAIQEANKKVEALQEERKLPQIGTTAVAGLIGNNTMLIANVGDSRAYVLSQGALFQVTRDHSAVQDMVDKGELLPEEAATHPKSGVITRWLGIEGALKIDTYATPLRAGDRWLFCSDGLYDMVKQNDILQIMLRSKEIEVCTRSLVDAANKQGGTDNISVIVVDIDAAEDATSSVKRPSLISVFFTRNKESFHA